MILLRYVVVVIGFGSLLVFSHPVFSDSLKGKLSTLQILPLKFGVNEFTVKGNKVMIVKGAHLSDFAGGGDTYQTLIEMKYAHDVTGENPFWQSVAVDDPGSSFIDLQETAPHTYEDALTSIQFMVEKNEMDLKELSSLYVFRSKRDFPGVLPDPSFTKLSLYGLKYPSADIGDMIYFKLIGAVKTKKKYSSADCAAYVELGVELPAYIKKDWCPQTKVSPKP
jgi:hypothetical protein